MENQETKNMSFSDKFWNNSSIIGIILMCVTFISSIVARMLGKATTEEMLIMQVGSIVMILFFLLLDVMNKLDEINKKLK